MDVVEVVVKSRVAGAPWPGVVVGMLAETHNGLHRRR